MASTSRALVGLLLLGLTATASAASVELKEGNFDDLVFNSGKNAFIKFQAPW